MEASPIAAAALSPVAAAAPSSVAEAAPSPAAVANVRGAAASGVVDESIEDDSFAVFDSTVESLEDSMEAHILSPGTVGGNRNGRSIATDFGRTLRAPLPHLERDAKSSPLSDAKDVEVDDSHDDDSHDSRDVLSPMRTASTAAGSSPSASNVRGDAVFARRGSPATRAARREEVLEEEDIDENFDFQSDSDSSIAYGALSPMKKKAVDSAASPTPSSPAANVDKEFGSSIHARLHRDHGLIDGEHSDSTNSYGDSFGSDDDDRFAA